MGKIVQREAQAMQREWLAPMEPVLVKEPFDHPDYVFQVKWDGVRILSFIKPTGVELYTRKGNLRTAVYPELAAIGQLVAGRNTVLDGEVVVFNAQGMPSFESILKRDLAGKTTRELLQKFPAFYFVFDILIFEGRDLRREPLFARQEILHDCLRQSPNIAVCDNYESGTALYETIKDKGMEGIVAKEKNGIYHSGIKHPTWLKIKCFREIKAIIGGIILKQGRVKSLLLGSEEGEKLNYLGKVSTGLNYNIIDQLQRVAENFAIPASPFAQDLKEDSGTRIVWIPPCLTALVEYLGKSDQGILRHPVLKKIGLLQENLLW